MKILIVDDEKNIRMSLSSMLRELLREDTVIEEAETGEAMLYIVKHFKPDIGFVDIQMPVMNGLEAIKAAKNSTPNTKWIILTGFPEFEYAQQAVEIGVSKFLLKPISKQELQSSFEKLMLLKKPESTKDYVEYAIAYSKEHFMEDIGIADIAYNLNITPNYLGNLFLKQTSIKYNDFLTEVRMNKAKEMLINTNMTVTKIAERVGYNSSKYFTNVFSKITNMSPSEYRENKSLL